MTERKRGIAFGGCLTIGLIVFAGNATVLPLSKCFAWLAAWVVLGAFAELAFWNLKVDDEETDH
jgi:hypothetical protein